MRDEKKQEEQQSGMPQDAGLPGYLRDVPQTGHLYGTLSYNRRSKCWTIKGEPCVTELAKRLFPGCDGRGRGVARFTAHRRIIGELNWLMLRYPLEIREGDRARVYVLDVRRSTRGVQIMISRSHPGLVRRLFEIEVPEIFDGTVEIKGIAREAGSRIKMSVWSSQPDVDAIGACVGPRGARVGEIIKELAGEKLDIVEYSEQPETYIANALAPAQVVSVTMLDEGKTCRVIVPDGQLSLAIGREGQNARLAAKLTGYKIDIKPESGLGQ